MGHGVKDLTLCAMLYALCVLLVSYVDEKKIFKNSTLAYPPFGLEICFKCLWAKAKQLLPKGFSKKISSRI